MAPFSAWRWALVPGQSLPAQEAAIGLAVWTALASWPAAAWLVRHRLAVVSIWTGQPSAWPAAAPLMARVSLRGAASLADRLVVWMLPELLAKESRQSPLVSRRAGWY